MLLDVYKPVVYLNFYMEPCTLYVDKLLALFPQD